MLYRVIAKFNKAKALEFHQKLTDGTIESQQPDGSEIVASMRRATIDYNGDINWTEMCFCSTPLKHERDTVYDKYFTDIKTELIEKYKIFEGKSFMEMLCTISVGSKL